VSLIVLLRSFGGFVMIGLLTAGLYPSEEAFCSTAIPKRVAKAESSPTDRVPKRPPQHGL